MHAKELTVLIAVPLQTKLVEAIATSEAGLDVLHEPDLLPPVRFEGDHRGVEGFRRDPDQERRWVDLLARAEVLFGIPGDSGEGLGAAVRSGPRLRWIQATAAGAGEQLRAASLTPAELARLTVTSASGVHATPLSEFCLFGLLAFAKSLPRLQSDQRAHRWDHYPMNELQGRTLLIIGMGSIGIEVARLAKAFGMRVLGVSRTQRDRSPAHRTHTTDELDQLLPQADAVVISLPLTDETRGLIDGRRIGLMKRGATFVNVGRGGVVDEAALITALRADRLAGAALDVFATEPLPADSPLWELPNVLISPHTAALSLRENQRIVALFIENLRRYRRGAELISRVDPELLY